MTASGGDFLVGDRVYLPDPGSTLLFGGKPLPHGPGVVTAIRDAKYPGAGRIVTVHLDHGPLRLVGEQFLQGAA